jgi:virginiamycin B lyase
MGSRSCSFTTCLYDSSPEFRRAYLRRAFHLVCGALLLFGASIRGQQASAQGPLPAHSGPMITSADGSIWFDEPNGIGRRSSSGLITTFSLSSQADSPRWLAVGADGNVWFTEANPLGRITAAGAITHFPAPGLGSHTPALARGIDGRLWYPAFQNKRWVFARMANNGTATDLLPDAPISIPEDASTLISGQNGTMWFIDQLANSAPAIASITPAGHVTIYPIPQAVHGVCAATTCFPTDLAESPDHSIWFSIYGRGFGRITPQGRTTYMPMSKAPEPIGGPLPMSLVFAPDGTLWFSEWLGAFIGRRTKTGATTEYVLEQRLDDAVGITLDTDGNVWSSLYCVNALVRVTTTRHIATYHIPGLPRDRGNNCPGI